MNGVLRSRPYLTQKRYLRKAVSRLDATGSHLKASDEGRQVREAADDDEDDAAVESILERHQLKEERKDGIFNDSLRRLLELSKTSLVKDPNQLLRLRDATEEVITVDREAAPVQPINVHDLINEEGKQITRKTSWTRSGKRRFALTGKELNAKKAAALNKLKVAVIPRGFFLVDKPRGQSSSWICHRLNSVFADIYHERRVDMGVNRRPEPLRLELCTGTVLDDMFEGLDFVGVGLDKRLAAATRARFPMQYVVKIRLGESTSNYLSTGEPICQRPYSHISQDDFDAEMQQSVCRKREEVEEDMLLDHRTWRQRVLQKHVGSAMQTDGDKEKLLHSSQLKSNRNQFVHLYTDPKYLYSAQQRGQWDIFGLETLAFELPHIVVKVGAVGYSWVSVFHHIAERLGSAAVITRAIRTSYGPFELQDGISPAVCSDPHEVAYAMEKTFAVYARSLGNPELFFESPEPTERFVRSQRDIFDTLRHRKQQAKMEAKEKRAMQLEQVRSEGRFKELARMTHDRTRKRRDSVV
mmetsp:Transcript_6543/g.19853  ORF Transcript_6543/g.19853 Transcript_6543/m.19853 type:complete len:526 (+) Transcript_6543:113-1690(+)